MTTESWLATFDMIDVSGLRNAAAGALITYMQRYGAAAGIFIEARRRGEQEVVIIELLTGAPQRPVYPICRSERVGVFFARAEAQPLVVILRNDFPDTEHQQLVPEGCPATICIDDRPWAEARLTWTPGELIERILSWFGRAARGELHDARQPIDPVFMGSPLSFLIPRSIVDVSIAEDLVADVDSEYRNLLRVKRAAEVKKVTKGMEPLSLAVYRVPPERMKRLRHAPDNLLSLATVLKDRGIDLIADLKARLSAWIAQGQTAAWRLNARFAVVVELPIVSPRGLPQDGADHRAFITAHSAGDIAVALGIAETPPDGLSKVGYVTRIGGATPDEAALAAIEAQVAEVYLEFEPDIAARLAGRSAPDSRKAVLVGGGAIGSHLADCLAREGRFCWTVIDEDRMLPHNLARHVARGDAVGRPKARLLAEHINETLTGPPRAQAIVANLIAPGKEAEAVKRALDESDLIIDATASILAARHLSDHAAAAPRASVFFNPAGDAVVLLVEPRDRAMTLRDLEAQYLRLVLRTERLAGHLGKEADTVAYTGACRAITSRIPQSHAVILSGLAASGLARTADSAVATISIWTLQSNGTVVVDTVEPQPVAWFGAGGWQIAIDMGLAQRIQALRGERLPSETGGILFGLVDIPAKRIHLVDAASAPPDSEEDRGSFVRGVQGVDELMDRARRTTAGQVRYVGEWHSHPPKSSARPSAVDGAQIDWLAALMQMESMPALMIIAADRELSVIFANERAESVGQAKATQRSSANG